MKRASPRVSSTPTSSPRTSWARSTESTSSVWSTCRARISRRSPVGARAAQAIPIEIAALLAQQAAQGLQYAHDARDGQGRLIGLVHRDVSPRNIFVTYHGVVKLLDFGMVRNPAGPKSVPGVFKGKYGYCAPEQLEGGRIDRRTDVFCLGVVLWECLTGARLFDGATDAETIGAVRSRPHRSAQRACAPRCPRALDQITLRALARDPSQRYQSAAELSEDLDRFLLGRNNRPTTKSVGQWIESLFGAERAALKKSISQGDNAEGALQRLNALDGAKPAAPKPRAIVEPRRQPAAGPLVDQLRRAAAGASVPEQMPYDELASTPARERRAGRLARACVDRGRAGAVQQPHNRHARAVRRPGWCSAALVASAGWPGRACS